jgi:hypothetical protein
MTGTIIPIGVGTSPSFPKLTSAGTATNRLVDPGNTNSPIIFEPPPALTGGAFEVWMIASGGIETDVTSAITTSGAALHFAGPLSPAIVPGCLAQDATAPTVIPIGATVLDVTVVDATHTTVTLDANVTGAGVGNVDTITFYSPNWGGCQVLISSDGSTYTNAGVIYRGARQGVLTATLASHADPDTVDTLSVDLAESQGQLLSGTATDADDFVTLCFCNGELVSYETATLTAAYRYDLLTRLRRGIYGTPIGSHSAGANFARFGPNDPSLFRYPYPASFVGKTISIKLPAFNIWGQALQSSAGLDVFTYTLTGAGAVQPMNVSWQFLAIPQINVPILLYTFGEAVNFPANFDGSPTFISTAATVTTIFDIAQNGTNFATMTAAAGATGAGALTFSGPASSFISGDVLSIIPRRTDATLAYLAAVLAGTS